MQYQKISDPADRASDDTLRSLGAKQCMTLSDQTICFMMRLIETNPTQYLAMVKKMTLVERMTLQSVIRARLEQEAHEELKDV